MDKNPNNNLFTDGKINLSATAIKAGAKELTRWQQNIDDQDPDVLTNLAMAVIREAWKAQHGFVPSLGSTQWDGDIAIKKPLTHVYGTTGAGKTELMNHIMNQAVSQGSRCLRIADQETRVLPERSIRVKEEGIWTRVPKWRHLRLLELLYPRYDSSLLQKRIDMQIGVFGAYLDTGDVLIVDMITQAKETEKINLACEKLAQRGVYVFRCDLSPLNGYAPKTDQTIVMKTVSQEFWTEQVFSNHHVMRPSLKEMSGMNPGQGMLVEREQITRFNPTEWQNSGYQLPDILKSAEDRLTFGLKLCFPKTHMQRLELLAKALGHRNWHAVQGMAANNR